ncbi:MAG: lysozyme [Pirellulales bacterium]
MKLSDEGLRLIKSFEGYHTKLKDGSCIAYRCPAGVWTLGWGCTEGVREGMIWTQKEATEALRREIAKFESAVEQAITRPMSQNQFDAMVSLAYNIGAAGFKRSSICRLFNKGDVLGAAKAFELWNKGGGRVLPGLVSRRKREAALFLKPSEQPDAPFMPQAVTETKEVSKPSVAVGAAAAAAGASQAIPSVPDSVTDAAQNLDAWKSIGDVAWSFKTWATSEPLIAGAVSLTVAGFWLWSKKKEAQP